MPKTIEDEFSSLPISRQYRYQLRNQKKGVCVKCGRDSGRQILCPRHKEKAYANPKRKCYKILINALATGKLKRGKCWCGLLGQAHHADYSKPLSVTWLCHKHHKEEHGCKPFRSRPIKITNLREYQREYQKRYREANREKLKLYARRYQKL